jgi:hypothetical protein
MDWNVVIVHAEGEENYAEKLSVPIRTAGYTVHHRGMVLVGESIIEQTSRALTTGGPVVLCGTVKAAGTRWPQWLVDVVRTAPGPRRLFTAKLDAEAYIERLVPDDSVIADCCSDSDFNIGVVKLIEALRKYYPPVLSVARIEDQPSIKPTGFMDGLTTALPDSEAVGRFRDQLRTPLRFPANLSIGEFLARLHVLREGRLTVAGTLMFGDTPQQVIPGAVANCTVYYGPSRAAERKSDRVAGTLPQQINAINEFISAHIRRRERLVHRLKQIVQAGG